LRTPILDEKDIDKIKSHVSHVSMSGYREVEAEAESFTKQPSEWNEFTGLMDHTRDIVNMSEY
jgi:hypothetical protein